MPELRNRFVAVVADGEGRVLALDGGLPQWETTGTVRWSNADVVTDALRDRFGIDAFVLRPLHAWREDDGRGTWAYELELRRPAGRGRWVGAAALTDAEQRRFAAAVLEEADRDEPLRAPWSLTGWYDRTLRWIDSELERLGRRRTGEPAQRHGWAISAVLRVPTDAGDVYFKAAPPLFGQEGAVTRALGERHQGRVTSVLAADDERRWMLMADIGGVELDDVADPTAWERAADEYARMQLDWVEHTDELLAAGCPDRTLDVLEDEIGETLADPLLLELPRGLGAEEARELPALAERLHAACGRLRRHAVPPSLEHGDLHPGNVRVRGGEPVFFDWTDAAVSHPLFTFADGAPFFDFRGAAPEPDRLRAVYAERWRSVLGSDARGALEESDFVGLFHWATGYRRIAHATEPVQRWELGSVFPWFVRRLLGAQPTT